MTGVEIFAVIGMLAAGLAGGFVLLVLLAILANAFFLVGFRPPW